MRTPWFWCLKLGAIIVLVDLLSLTAGNIAAGRADFIAYLADLIDHVVNLGIFGYVGWHTGKVTGRATSSAEAGVATSILPAIVAALLPLTLKLDVIQQTSELTLQQQVIGGFALNIALGGLVAWSVGLISTREQKR